MSIKISKAFTLAQVLALVFYVAKSTGELHMEYRQLGRSGLKVSLHTLGTMNFSGGRRGGGGWSTGGWSSGGGGSGGGGFSGGGGGFDGGGASGDW